MNRKVDCIHFKEKSFIPCENMKTCYLMNGYTCSERKSYPEKETQKTK